MVLRFSYWFLLVTMLYSCTPSSNETIVLKEFKSAIRYNDFIIKLQENVYEAIIDLSLKMEYADDVELLESYEAFGSEANKAANEIRTLGAYKDNTEFRDLAIELFDFYVEVYEFQYKELIDMIILGEYDEEIEERMGYIINDITEKETRLDSKFQAVQERFAKQFNMEIGENELQKRIDEI